MEQIKELRQENAEIKTVEKVCAIHGKYMASVFGIGSQLIYSMCPMCEKSSKKDFSESAYKKQEHIKALEKMNVDTEYFDLTLDDYNAQNETQQSAKEATGKLICNELQKLILLGSNGLGKTMLGAIAVQAIGGAIYSAYEISLIVNGAENKYAELKKLSQLPLLVIDEYEKVKDSEARKDLFSYLINKRHSNKMRTMILSEYHLFKSCKNHGCERCFDRLMTNDLISRLQQNGAIIEITGNDYRIKNK